MGNCLRSGKIEKRDICKKELKDINPKKVASFPWQNECLDCYVYKVYDGDTVKVLFYYNDLLFKYSIRIIGIDTPELLRCSTLEKQAGIKVKYYLKNLIEHKMVKIYCFNFDKYGARLDGNIYYNGTNISEELVNKKYAKLYDGKSKKEEWSKEDLEYILNN